MELVNELPKSPEPHPIIELVRKKVITIHQLSLRIEKSYGHTRNLVSGFAKLNGETLQIFNQILEQMEGYENKKNKT